jgi:hypothetical protein
MNEEDKKALRELGISIDALEDLDQEPAKLHPVAAVAFGSFCIVNIGLLLSLPPVLRGRGTFR